jgi:hypothetical protein
MNKWKPWFIKPPTEDLDELGRVWFILNKSVMARDWKGREFIAEYCYDSNRFFVNGKPVKILIWREL